MPSAELSQELIQGSGSAVWGCACLLFSVVECTRMHALSLLPHFRALAAPAPLTTAHRSARPVTTSWTRLQSICTPVTPARTAASRRTKAPQLRLSQDKAVQEGTSERCRPSATAQWPPLLRRIACRGPSPALHRPLHRPISPSRWTGALSRRRARQRPRPWRASMPSRARGGARERSGRCSRGRMSAGGPSTASGALLSRT